jgi:hypothetical protein
MESEEYRADEGVASDIAAAIDILRRLVRGKRLDHGLKGIKVSIGGVSTGGQEPGVIDCKVTIQADSAANLKTIKGKFPKKDGWKCTDGADGKSSVCTNP